MLGEIEVRGVEGLVRLFAVFPKLAKEAENRGLEKCGVTAVRVSKDYAPESPTKAQYLETLKRKKKSKRKEFHPGQLKQSIQYEVRDGACTVFVAENGKCKSKSGYNYAKRIHDEKGKTWHKRGPGTEKKGLQADDKFIERAIRDNEGVFNRIMVDEFDKAIRSAK